MEALRDFFYDKAVNKILDVGTGTGSFIEILKEAFNGAVIVGVDPDGNALSEARKKSPDILFQKGSAEDLPFGDNTFDMVSLSMALHHLQKVKKGLKELKRVVKPDGWIIINELFSDNLSPAQEVHKMFHHFRSKIDRLNGVSHRETFRKEEIFQIVRQAGISVQFFFEHKKNTDVAKDVGAVANLTESMATMLETIKGMPEYDELYPKIDEFREKAQRFGFQPATTVVIVGKKQHPIHGAAS